MYQILTLNKISATGLDRLPAEQYTHGNEIAQPDAIMVRSASMHEMELDQKTVAIARAGAGVNNIPVDACSEQGIVVFNTPGANANAVKELVLCALLLTSRKIVPAIDWCKTLKAMRSASWSKKENRPLLARRLRAKRWVLSALAQSEFWLQMQQRA